MAFTHPFTHPHAVVAAVGRFAALRRARRAVDRLRYRTDPVLRRANGYRAPAGVAMVTASLGGHPLPIAGPYR